VAELGDIRAVNVTAWPTVDGFGEELNPTLVAALFTMVCIKTADVLEALFASPP
jgi:hypothetical protein